LYKALNHFINIYKLVFNKSSLFLTVAGCTYDDENIDYFGVACTLELRRFAVILTDSNNYPVALDHFTVTDITNNEDLTTELKDNQYLDTRKMGIYPLYGDQFAQLHQNQLLEIVLKVLLMISKS
jgi:hypothetical protein